MSWWTDVPDCRGSWLTHEFELREYWTARGHCSRWSLVRERGQSMLVVDYAGGEPPDRLTRDSRFQAILAEAEVGRQQALAAFREAGGKRLLGR